MKPETKKEIKDILQLIGFAGVSMIIVLHMNGMLGGKKNANTVPEKTKTEILAQPTDTTIQKIQTDSLQLHR